MMDPNNSSLSGFHIGHVGVSQNSGFSSTSSILIGFSIINHPFWDTPIFGTPHVDFYKSNYKTNMACHRSNRKKKQTLTI